MTDARIVDSLVAVAAGMPPQSAIVIRSFALPAVGQAKLIRRLRYISRARRHALIWSGPNCPPGYDGRHGPSRRRGDRLLVMPVHNPREAAAAKRQRGDAVFISPVHLTRSHPGAPVLRVRGFARLAAAVPCPAIGLGGMDGERYRSLRRHGASGWAAIDGWSSGGALSSSPTT